ncbi:alpha/beta hydrolase [Halopiger xanaduensis]|uniref:Hydrolase of the alpha/beta superfamily-like protein n=1 Tax=Halopiger xanaduensis (strain DSM 18323 / JCM 14033 / SH-6) TaxID=797210 RepID=F8D6G6_HALXS|nr:dienelactone hydrolase family protein [Halopiger xanaduensis]AEH36553.1 hydrolase of the alpha/beta superfamily-like protein [Halopiger xanaduensis SH-6]
MTDVLVPGGRDVRGTLEEPEDGDPDAIVVACPPHPQQGGSRSDRRLVAVSDALVEAEIASLRFDYGDWDEGYGERADVRNAVRWAADRHDRVGLFGYSFGATLALLGAAECEAVDAVSALAPTARLADDLDAVAALESISCPVQVCYGERDTTVEWEPIVERLRETAAGTGDRALVPRSGDHFFVGQQASIAEDVAAFFESKLLEAA